MSNDLLSWMINNEAMKGRKVVRDTWPDAIKKQCKPKPKKRKLENER